MWMKNTYLPLDMLFIGKDGKVRSIKENAEPLSETIIDSKGPIDFVLELNLTVQSNASASTPETASRTS